MMFCKAPVSIKAGVQSLRAISTMEAELVAGALAMKATVFCSNMLTARATHDLFPPVSLAFWRWFCTLLLLMPFTATALWQHRAALRREWLEEALAS